MTKRPTLNELYRHAVDPPPAGTYGRKRLVIQCTHGTSRTNLAVVRGDVGREVVLNNTVPWDVNNNDSEIWTHCTRCPEEAARQRLKRWVSTRTLWSHGNGSVSSAPSRSCTARTASLSVCSTVWSDCAPSKHNASSVTRGRRCQDLGQRPLGFQRDRRATQASVGSRWDSTTQLDQNDQIIALLREQVTQQQRTNQLLAWLGGLLAPPKP